VHPKACLEFDSLDNSLKTKILEKSRGYADPRTFFREKMVEGVPLDKRFVYYLMGATGIVVVPLTGFQCEHHGFRITLLESDDAKRAWILKTLRESIDSYVAS